MKIAYFDCMSGISGDMTLGALVDAGVSFDCLQDAIRSLDVAKCRLEKEEVKRHGFRATKIHVRHEHEHAHRHLHHIHEIIDRGNLSDPQRDLARRIFQRLAEAEAKVHGSTLEKVHFHEVGAVDSIADIIGSAVGMTELGVDRFEASLVPTGCGKIVIAHGEVSVPAPATADLMRGIPIAPSNVEFELTTPTGAAILATVVDRFGPVGAMTIDQIGYGAGDKELESQANVLRLLVGHANQANTHADTVVVIETNLDDSTGEAVGHCVERLLDAGALDVYATPIQMKKNRPGTKITVLTHSPHSEKLESILFAETSTLGVRKWQAHRSILSRVSTTVATEWGEIEGKLVERPEVGQTFSPEYESCREVAETHKIPLAVVYDTARKAFASQG